MGGQPRAGGQPFEVDLASCAAQAAGALDVEDLAAVEDREADAVAGARAQLLQVGTAVLAQPARVECRQAQVGDAQPEPVLAVSALLEVAEREQRDGVAVGGAAAHAELLGDLGDAASRALGAEAAEDCEAALERLRIAGVL